MSETFKMPEIYEDETVFIRRAGEMRFPEVRKNVINLLSFRFQNELNHVQFMEGFGKAHHERDSFVEDNRDLMLEWERQTRRVRELGQELDALEADTQALFDEANYTLQGGAFTQPLFSTKIEDWEDMLVWRWMRARAWSCRSIVEFGSLYIPLSQLAFDQYFDLALARWPAASTKEPVERVAEFYRSGMYEPLIRALHKWYPLGLNFVSFNQEHQDELIDLRVWTRKLDLAVELFEECIKDDMRHLGVPHRKLAA